MVAQTMHDKTLRLQLNQIHLRDVRRTPLVHHTALPIQARVLVADPDMFAGLLRAHDLIITDLKLIFRYPYHSFTRSESLMLERVSHELIPLPEGQVLDLIIDPSEQRFANTINPNLLNFDICRFGDDGCGGDSQDPDGRVLRYHIPSRFGSGLPMLLSREPGIGSPAR